ncbi:hypothetical protein [Deinococcus cellulosilyticus]|uniref:Uncharacterized protein n=1 Tax=Deinococcus cellulosilyticus (strain DSM 18568 / NBRC 106333 / KACC 11606 / 5516J-15) TaxID=1223518 RepID=A0A511N284_DEIC1|nr:hypothetical protein [Deinococcus cellulosilyticus]GEM46962.1 hypothetical protein DC3_25970 [Deinococcus cellulosilyticus NBRC 106333 = KACC 11606]
MPETPQIAENLAEKLERLELNLQRWERLGEKLPDVILAVEHLERRAEDAILRMQQEMDRHREELNRLQPRMPAVPKEEPRSSASAQPAPVDASRMKQDLLNALHEQMDCELQAFSRNALDPLHNQMQHLKISVQQMSLSSGPAQPIPQGPSTAVLESQIMAQQQEINKLKNQLQMMEESQQTVQEQQREGHQVLSEHVQSLQGGIQGLQSYVLQVEKSTQNSVQNSIQQLMQQQATDREHLNHSLQQLEHAFNEFQSWYQGAKPLARLFSRPK